MRPHLPLLAFTALFAAPLLASPASAHAIVIDSVPANNATIAGPDLAISLHFNSRLDRKRSRITLRMPDGTAQNVDITGDEPDRLESAATGLAPGAYKLHWQVLAVDGHITSGDIPFQITAP